MLWLEDISPYLPVVVGISGSDEIIHSSAVVEYVQLCQDHRKRLTFIRCYFAQLIFYFLYSLTSDKNIKNIELVYWQGFFHGQVLLGGERLFSFGESIRKSEGNSCSAIL
jgi:hypothetical protein